MGENETLKYVKDEQVAVHQVYLGGRGQSRKKFGKTIEGA